MNPEDFKIFLAEISMIKQFVELEAICFSGDIINPPEYRKLFNRSNVRIYGVWFKEKLIASAILICKVHRKRAHLYSLCVHPGFRSVGIARALLDGIEQQLASENYITLYLELRTDNLLAYQCYANFGYITFGRFKKFYEDEADALRMQKILTQREGFKKSKLSQHLGI